MVHAALFEPGSMPPPSAEVFQRNAEKWQTHFEGTERMQEQ